MLCASITVDVVIQKKAIIQSKHLISERGLATFVCSQMVLVNMSDYVCKGGLEFCF